jgi:hypothetical protein
VGELPRHGLCEVERYAQDQLPITLGRADKEWRPRFLSQTRNEHFSESGHIFFAHVHQLDIVNIKHISKEPRKFHTSLTVGSLVHDCRTLEASIAMVRLMRAFQDSSTAPAEMPPAIRAVHEITTTFLLDWHVARRTHLGGSLHEAFSLLLLRRLSAQDFSAKLLEALARNGAMLSSAVGAIHEWVFAFGADPAALRWR